MLAPSKTVDAKQYILKRLDETCRACHLDDMSEIQWSDGQMLHRCATLAERGDPSGWREFITHINSNRDVANGFIRLFEDLGWAKHSCDDEVRQLAFPKDAPLIDEETSQDLFRTSTRSWNLSRNRCLNGPV